MDLDAGATLDGDQVDYGKDVTKEAIDGADFKWTKTSAADARSGCPERHLRLRRHYPARLLRAPGVRAVRRPDAGEARHDDGRHELVPGLDHRRAGGQDHAHRRRRARREAGREDPARRARRRPRQPRRCRRRCR
ncbi:hypothetical protein Q9Q99_16010 [Curtobacterium flaccumfaciens]|nr:hypothetical protein Q9Q99_16010 [Curtobacterium flaccumfaciens]